MSYLAALSISQGQSAPVVANTGCTFRVSGRVQTSAKVTFGITTLTLDGGFAGKYFSVCTIEASDADGNFDIELPLTDFQPLAKLSGDEFAQTPDGLECVDWWCITKDKKSKLAIRQVELLPAASP